jgi:hypothetical protein
MAVIYTPHFVQFFDNNGDPLSNGKLYAYSAGTTTPKATFTTEEGDVQNSNPVVLDSSGRATVFIDGSYRFDLFDQNDVLIKSTDDVKSFTTLTETGNSFFQSFSGDGSQTVFTLSETLGTDSKTIMVYVNSGVQDYVVNGTFANDTDWTKGTGWTIGSGVATATGAISTALEQESDVTLIENQAYILTYTVTRSAGGIIPSIGGRDGVERTASGTYSEIINAGSTQDIEFTGNSFTGTIDNVVVNPANSLGYEIQNPSAYTISGTSLTFTTAPPEGTDSIYVFAPAKVLGAASASAAAAASSEASAAASAQAAASSAAAAAAASLVITSTTSVAIGTGSKTFTVIEDLAIAAGQWLIIASDAAPSTNYMTGVITSYSTTTLIVNVTQAFGSGTLADWTIKLSGVEGIQGIQGPTGALAPGAGIVVSSNDTNPDTLEAKLIAGEGVSFSTQNDGADETRTINAGLVLDTTPQLGGMLDVNGQAIGDGTLELVTFTEDASAVNHINIENEATGSGPIISAVGDDTNIDLNLNSKGAGAVKINGINHDNRAYAEYTANTNITTIIPFDDTTPQNSEGTEILSVTIDPSSATAKLAVRVSGSVSSNINEIVIAVFANGTAVLATPVYSVSSTQAESFMVEVEFTPGTTDTQTITVRAGPGITGNIRFNGTNSARLFGGVAKTVIVVEEVSP